MIKCLREIQLTCQNMYTHTQ